MAIHCAATEHGGLIKKESSWVKLKAFRRFLGRPNKSQSKYTAMSQSCGVAAMLSIDNEMRNPYY